MINLFTFSCRLIQTLWFPLFIIVCVRIHELSYIVFDWLLVYSVLTFLSILFRSAVSSARQMSVAHFTRIGKSFTFSNNVK